MHIGRAEWFATLMYAPHLAFTFGPRQFLLLGVMPLRVGVGGGCVAIAYTWVGGNICEPPQQGSIVGGRSMAGNEHDGEEEEGRGSRTRRGWWNERNVSVIADHMTSLDEKERD